MTERKLKKITVASIFFTIFIFIPAFLVFVFTDFSVSDPGVPEPGEIEIKSVDKVELTDNKVSLVAELRNPNSDFGVRSFDYSFVEKRASEKRILAKGTSFILPSQTKHLLKLEVPLGKSLEGKLGLELQKIDWQRAAGVRTDSLWVANGSYAPEDDSTRITGTLINDSPLLIEKVQVRALIYDKNDTLRGVTRTQLGDVRAEEQRDFKTYINYPVESGESLIFEADANLIDKAS